MKRTVEIVSTLFVAGALFVIPASLMQPAPVPSLTALVGGLVGFWVASRGRMVGAGLGALIGTVAGVGLHAYRHYSEDRLKPAGGLLSHLAVDAILGLVIAVVVLAGTVAAYRVVVQPLTRCVSRGAKSAGGQEVP